LARSFDVVLLLVLVFELPETIEERAEASAQ
jgi:hypothetical protein